MSYSLESLYYERILGARKESRAYKWWAAGLAVGMAYVHAKLRGLEVVGSPPLEGGALMVANHTGMSDVLDLIEATRTSSRRGARFCARRDLLDPDYKEPEEVAAKLGKKVDILHSRISYPIRKYLLAPSIRAGGTIGVPRRSYARETLKEIGRIEETGELLLCFVQDSRVKSGDLSSNIVDGIGYVARLRANLAIVPTTIEGRRIIFGESFCFSQIKDQEYALPLNTPAGVTLYLVDKIANNFEGMRRDAWHKEQRERFIAERLERIAAKKRG